MFQTKISTENQNTHLILNNFSPHKSCHLSDNVTKYGTAGQAIGGNIAHAHCMLDTKGYKDTLTICTTTTV